MTNKPGVFRLEVSFRHTYITPLLTANNEQDAMRNRKNIVVGWLAKLDKHNEMMKTLADGAEAPPTPNLELEFSDMESTELYAHLDGNFGEPSRTVMTNQHRLGGEPAESLVTHTITGVMKDGTIPADARLVLAACHVALNQYGTFCPEDGGQGSVLLSEIIQAWGNRRENKPAVLASVPLLFSATDAPEQKGSVDLIIHSVTHPVIRPAGPLANLAANVPNYYQLANQYLGEFTSQLSRFIPVAGGVEGLNCPLYPSETLFVGKGQGAAQASSTALALVTPNKSEDEGLTIRPVPLPAYLRFADLDVCTSFFVNILKVMLDRERHINYRDESNKQSYSHALTGFFKQYMKSLTNNRARYMAKFITLYIQTLDYHADVTFYSANGSGSSKVPVERFSEIYIYKNGDCEDSARGILRMYNTFLNTMPHLELVYRCIDSLKEDQGGEASIFGSEVSAFLAGAWKEASEDSKSTNPNTVMLRLHQTEAFWTELTVLVFNNLEGVVLPNLIRAREPVTIALTMSGGEKRQIHVSSPGSAAPFSYLGGNLEALLFALLFRDFHKIACFYVDAFTLFGVRDTHVQNVPQRAGGETDATKKRSYPEKPKQPTPRSKEERQTEAIHGAHAAVLMLPYTTVVERVKMVDPGHLAASLALYWAWIKGHGYGPGEPDQGRFPGFDYTKLEALILEGTGMLEPSSRKDLLAWTRKTLYSLPIFATVKKELIPEHADSPFYQSVILMVIGRFMDVARVATFNVGRRIDLNGVLEQPDSKFAQCVIKGLHQNDKILTHFSNESTQASGGSGTTASNQKKAQLLGELFTDTSPKIGTVVGNYITKYLDIFQAEKGDAGSLKSSYVTPSVGVTPSVDATRMVEPIYTKGVPFYDIMTMDKEVCFIPFGFTRKNVHQKLSQDRTLLEAYIQQQDGALSTPIGADILGKFTTLSEPLMGNVSPQRLLEIVDTNIQTMEAKFFLQGTQSVAEFDTETLQLMDNVVKQAPLAPKLVAGDVALNPCVYSYQLPEDSRYRYLDALFKLYPQTKPSGGGSETAKLSVYLKLEQLPTETSIAQMGEQMRDFYPDGFIRSVDYTIENYTNTSNAIRIDFWVKNLDT